MHNLNSHKALQRVNASWYNVSALSNVRPFILLESSWVGSGSMGVGLITDMKREWDSLKGVIAQAYSLSMAGMNNLMVDGCGSLGLLDEELCARWMQLAAFMPMFRGYYNATYTDSKGNRLPTDPSEYWNFKNQDYQIAYTSAIANRMPYLRYIYSQLYRTYRVGGAIVRPLIFDNPTDTQTYNNVEETYMLGDSIKVSPVLRQGLKDGD